MNNNKSRQTHLITNLLLQRPILLDMLAFFLPRGLALVERRRRDAGNSVLDASKPSTSLLPRIQVSWQSRTYACHPSICTWYESGNPLSEIGVVAMFEQKCELFERFKVDGLKLQLHSPNFNRRCFVHRGTFPHRNTSLASEGIHSLNLTCLNQGLTVACQDNLSGALSTLR